MNSLRNGLASCLSALLLASLSGCSGGSEVTCDPMCPSGTHCTETGCVPDSDSTADLAVAPGADLAGACVPACAGATPYCVSGRCVACTDDSKCPAGQICKTVGNTQTCIPGCNDDARCKAGGNAAAACCGNACIDTSKDVANCGACGKACAAVHAAASCVGGACMSGKCDGGWGDCNGNVADGCETNLQSDVKNCGACGTTCKIPNAIPGCADTCYIAACQFGFDDCNADDKDGCETAVLSDVKNCGGCGMPCAGVPHAQTVCINAACQLKQCDPGYTDCDGNSKNGCETVIASDVKNCGACGNVCPQGLVCTNGSCTCPMCNIPNSKTKCVNNQCVFDQCLPGYTDCDNNPNNGCESATGSDPNNCGGCGNVCPQNLPGCSGGQCVLGWFPVGVQQNIPVKMAAGWVECYRDQYGNANASIAQILQKCNGSKLMLACGKTADPSTLVLAAWAPASDVTFMTAGQGNPADVHLANGVGWYYNTQWSWGFVQGGDVPQNNSCDVANGNSQFRMCWHASGGNLSGGYRCGATTGLNGDRTWDRIIFTIP